MEHTSFGRRERERERLTVDTFQKGGLWIFSLSLSRARRRRRRRSDGPKRPPSHTSRRMRRRRRRRRRFIDRPTERKGERKEKERKREMPRRPEKKIVVMVAKGIMCWRENRVEFKKTKIKKVSIAYRRLFFFLFPHLAVLLSHTSEKTKKTKTCRSLSLSLSFRLEEALSSKAMSFF